MTSKKHVRGLDSIRFVAAGWVALSHGAAFPLKALWLAPGPIGHIVIGVYDCLFDGVAAVIVFFVISGFCIHYPWARAESLDVRSHLVRRYVRIGVPLLAVLACSQLIGGEIAEEGRGVLWSVYCELIYYSLYPALFVVFRKHGVLIVLIASTVLSVLLIASHPYYLWVWEFGLSLTWLELLPSWLLGCLLAERVAKGAAVPIRGSIIVWRATALIYTSAATVIVFHAPVKLGYPVTMLVFSFFAFFWAEQEILRFVRRPPSQIFEWLGSWSYSIYLIHNMVLPAVGLAVLPPFLAWITIVVGIFGASYAFAVLVEFPSHHLARLAARSIAAEESAS